ncbi:hypothetical protein [Arthrobacter sp. AFG7.2]|uniref:hypothetical protein n=1 Tax=Arthrobacter sp. AFG7.2 TaxID=1688693 RepID=UPI0016703411|nr:hypothetical protein [Arthrobacter sp. AFG7.2]
MAPETAPEMRPARVSAIDARLAHPGLMLLAGMGTSVLAFLLGPVELTIEALL